MSNHKDFIPQGKAVSKAQWHFFKRQYDQCPPGDITRRKALLDALDVDYRLLPDRAGAPKAKPQVQTPAKPPRENLPPLKFPPEGFATVSGLFHLNGVKLTAEKRDYVNNLGYLIQAPGLGIIAAVHNVEKRQKLKALMPFVRTILTQREATSFLAVENERIHTLKQIAELLASPAPAEPTVKPPPAADKPWVDDENPFADSTYADEDDDNEVFN